MINTKKKSNSLFKFLLLFVLLHFGCNESNKERIASSSSSNSTIEIQLPEKVNINEEYYGKIVYVSEFDTINLRKDEARAITFYSACTKKLSKSFEDLKKTKLDTFVRINDSIVFVNNIYFKKEGRYFLEGYIVDEILLNRDEGKDPVLSTIETKVVHPILVSVNE